MKAEEELKLLAEGIEGYLRSKRGLERVEIRVVASLLLERCLDSNKEELVMSPESSKPEPMPEELVSMVGPRPKVEVDDERK